MLWLHFSYLRILYLFVITVCFVCIISDHAYHILSFQLSCYLLADFNLRLLLCIIVIFTSWVMLLLLLLLLPFCKGLGIKKSLMLLTLFQFSFFSSIFSTFFSSSMFFSSSFLFLNLINFCTSVLSLYFYLAKPLWPFCYEGINHVWISIYSRTN